VSSPTASHRSSPPGSAPDAHRREPGREETGQGGVSGGCPASRPPRFAWPGGRCGGPREARRPVGRGAWDGSSVPRWPRRPKPTRGRTHALHPRPSRCARRRPDRRPRPLPSPLSPLAARRSPLAARRGGGRRGRRRRAVRLTGVTAGDTKPRHVEPGDSRVTRLKLYTPKEKFAGDAGARCAAVGATEHRVTVRRSPPRRPSPAEPASTRAPRARATTPSRATASTSISASRTDVASARPGRQRPQIFRYASW
jgi:hypothetical protein